jgi:hypothetical protein
MNNTQCPKCRDFTMRLYGIKGGQYKFICDKCGVIPYSEFKKNLRRKLDMIKAHEGFTKKEKAYIRRQNGRQESRRRNWLLMFYSKDCVDLYFKHLMERNWKALKKLCRCNKPKYKFEGLPFPIDGECPACQMLRLKKLYGETKSVSRKENMVKCKK